MSLHKRYLDCATQGKEGNPQSRPRSNLRERGNNHSDGGREPVKQRQGEIKNAYKTYLCAFVKTYVPMR